MLAAAHNVECGNDKPVIQKLLSKTDIKIRSKIVRYSSSITLTLSFHYLLHYYYCYSLKELQTALMLSVSSGSLGLVTLLLEAGANINAQDKVSGTITYYTHHTPQSMLKSAKQHELHELTSTTIQYMVFRSNFKN